MNLIPRAAVIGLALAAFLAIPTAAQAAEPTAKAQYAHHDHSGAGQDWHVEIEVGKNPRRLKLVVVYVQECDATAFAENVPVDEAGKFAVTSTMRKGGTWSIEGTFPTPEHVHGTYKMANAKCDTGERIFDAHKASAGGDGGGHSGHGHVGGTAPGAYANLSKANNAQIARAGRVWAASLAAAQRRPFNSYTATRQLYDITAVNRRRPLVFHLYRAAYNKDPYLFSASRPESLVYWWPRKGRPILVAFMFRANGLKPPSLMGDIFGWHTHAKKTPPMTHVWLTRDLRSAAANCMPVKELERSVPGFKYVTPRQFSGPESLPCGAVGGDGHGGHDH